MLHHCTARLIVLSVLVVLTALVWYTPTFEPSCDCLTVSFLDVGQGDAIYIRTPDGVEVLVDGGANAAVLHELSLQRSFFDREIDLVIATHPDLDHIGGLIDVLERFSVAAIMTTTNQHKTPAAAAFAAAVGRENATVIYPEAGQRYLLGASTTLTIFSPHGDETNWESNSASIVAKVTFGETDMLLTGDAPIRIENYLVERYGPLLASEVLKLGHHGSRTSTSELFLDTVQPQFAVVSAAVDNRYNHPHPAVVERVKGSFIELFHTGHNGSITFRSNGRQFIKETPLN
jgi:competence protein ComEC